MWLCRLAGNRSQTTGWRLLLWGLLLLPGAASVAQPLGSRGPGPGFGGGQDPTQSWRADLAEARGFLILDGQYVPLPFQIAIDGQTLTINDQPVRCSAARPEGRPHRSRPGGDARRLGDEIVQNLMTGQVVVALPDQPLIVVPDGKGQYDLLKMLAGDQRPRVSPVSLQGHLAAEIDETVWNAWITGFVPRGDFAERALAKNDLVDRAEAEAVTAIAATRRLNTFSYPLSVLGMVFTTLGIGHLLSHRPPVDAKSLETDASPLAIKVLTYSLVLVIVYSALDLTWTILAHQAGQMIELNPLGSHLVENPLHLIAFKTAATGMAVGLLFMLRKYRKAQLAAWWVCLVCTLLTARWLTISPMFAA